MPLTTRPAWNRSLPDQGRYSLADLSIAIQIDERICDLALVETHVHLKLESMTRNDLADTFVVRNHEVCWRAMTPRCFD
jgi:hypothetical protein